MAGVCRLGSSLGGPGVRAVSSRCGRAAQRGARRFADYSWDRVPSAVRLTDVSPRDGLQNEARHVDTATKLELVARLRAAGLRSIEATSFVNPRLVPQMADAGEVLAACLADPRSSGVDYTVLVPNLRGLQAAHAAGAREVTVLAAASDTFSRKNTNCSLEESLRRAVEVAREAERLGVRPRAAVAVCLGCPFEGEVLPQRAVEVVLALLEAGCQEVAICDTVGTGTPASVRRLLGALAAAGAPTDKLAVHLHDTYGQAVANILVALQHGVARVDAAAGGLGGCPFAGPGAGGNVATEDVVRMLDGLGVDTGVDIDALAETGDWICREVLGRPTGSKAGFALQRKRAAAASSAAAAAPEGAGGEAAARASKEGHAGPRLPLAGLRVVEVGPGLVAGGWTGATLAYFGAEVLKVEPPGTGDGIRKWRHLDGPGGDSLWWQSIARNKRSVALDLRKDEGRALLRRLIGTADVLVENFKPGTLEKWGMGPDALREENPRLVVARISGYGQTGPKAVLPGFASVCEGAGGFRYVNGFPGMPPVRPNLSIGDTLAATNAIIGILLALLRRARASADNGRDAAAEARGQDVDSSIAEGVFGLLESCVPEFDRLGVVREPSGSSLTGIVPTGTYPCLGGLHVIIGANGDSLFQRLMQTMGREDLAKDSRLADNAGRVEHQQTLDSAIAKWTATRTVEEVQAACDAVAVPCGPINSVREIFNDEHFKARGCFETVLTADGQPLKVPSIAPRLSDSPGRTLHGGPRLGQHTDEVLSEVLRLTPEELTALRAGGVVA